MEKISPAARGEQRNRTRYPIDLPIRWGKHREPEDKAHLVTVVGAKVRSRKQWLSVSGKWEEGSEKEGGGCICILHLRKGFMAGGCAVGGTK